MRRPLATLSLALLPLLVAAQNYSGTYRPEKGQPATWQINQHLTLIWNNTPYLPVGLRITGSAEEIARAKAAGIQDLIVDVPRSPQGWSELVTALEGNGMRYLLALDTLTPGAKGYAIEPQAYRVGGITDDTLVDFPLPGVTTALALLVTQRDRTVQSVQRVAVEDDRFKLEVKSLSRLEHVLIVYPEMEHRAQPDYWEGFDRHRDELLSALKNSKLGPGFRGLINPMGASIDWTRRQEQFVPNNGYFQMELKAHLLEQYRNVDTVKRAWSMSSSDVDSFEMLVRLVPLWTGERGVANLWDPQTDKLYQCNMKQSTIWSDINRVIQTAALRRIQRLSTAIKQVADVPIVQEWSGWNGPYEGRNPGFDGLGMVTKGTGGAAVTEAGSRATSSIMRWGKPGWLLATDVQVDAAEDAATKLPMVLDDVASMGARGIFVTTAKKEVTTAAAAEHVRRSVDMSYSQYSPSTLFFPESAGNPAHAQLLPGGKWWLPAPVAGNRLDFGAGVSGYSYNDGSSTFTAVWSTAGPVRMKLRMSNPKVGVVTTSDGSDPKPKFHKNALEVNLTDAPLLLSGSQEIPIPESAFVQTAEKYKLLLNTAEKLHANVAEENLFFADAVKGFDRDPSGTYFNLRAHYWRLTQKMAFWTWIEAESTRSSNFSEIQPNGGACGGAVLTLRSPVTTDARGFFAEYTAQIRTADELEVWIAAKIPQDQRKLVQVSVGGQVLSIDSEGVSGYANGFAWYRCGTTKLKTGNNKIVVQVNSPEGADMAIDAIVLHPGRFTPNGVMMPEIPLVAGPAK